MQATRTCSINGCERKHYGHGLRVRHQDRLDRIAAADQRLEQAQHDGASDSWWEEP